MGQRNFLRFFICLVTFLILVASVEKTAGGRTTLQTTTTRTTTLAPGNPLDWEDLDEDDDEDEENIFDEILKKTNATIETASLQLYKQRTRLSLNFLNKIIPVLQTIRSNMTDLLKSTDTAVQTSGSQDNSPSPSTTPLPFSEFKVADDILENQLMEIEDRMKANHYLIDLYSESYRNAAEKMREVQDTLALILERGLETSRSASRAGGEITTCGGSFKSRQGAISYKMRQGINPTEGCLWIIQAADNSSTTGISFTLDKALFEVTYSSYVAIGYFRDMNYHDSSALIWTKFRQPPTVSTPASIEVPGYVAFVQFVSAASNSGAARSRKGFHLTFQQTSSRVQAYNPNSPTPAFVKASNIFIEGGPSGVFRYPQNGSMYDINERVAIVFKPCGPNTDFYVKWIQTEATHDPLSIYSYLPHDYAWTRKDFISGIVNTNMASSYATHYSFPGPRSDPLLLTFRSDHSNNYYGFQVYWNTAC